MLSLLVKNSTTEELSHNPLKPYLLRILPVVIGSALENLIATAVVALEIRLLPQATGWRNLCDKKNLASLQLILDFSP